MNVPSSAPSMSSAPFSSPAPSMSSAPPAKFIAVVGDVEYDVPGLGAMNRFTNENLDGNFYIDSVLFQHCPSDATVAAHTTCDPSPQWGTQMNLLKSSQKEIDLSIGAAILSPILHVRHNGGAGTTRRESVRFHDGGVTDAISIDISIPNVNTTFTISEGFGKGGLRNEITSDTSIPSGKAFAENNLSASFFGVGWGESHFITEYNQSKSDAATGLYCHDFVVAQRGDSDKLIFRTFLVILKDDGTPIQIPHKVVSGYSCCR